MIIIKSKAEIQEMRKAGRVVAQVLMALGEKVKPGVTTGALDRLAEDMIASFGAKPAFKGYRGYPATICTAVNDEVVHGIPGERVLHEGDIVGIDMGVVLNGFYGDAAMTFPVGRVSPEVQRLLTVTREGLDRAVESAVPGKRIGDLSHAIQAHVEREGFSVVREFVGHGIGRNMHEEPQVPNFGEPGTGIRIKPGMTLAIEPMVNAGRPEVEVMEDNWTARTRDRSLSAHFEHTVAVTDNGPVVLTLP